MASGGDFWEAVWRRKAEQSTDPRVLSGRSDYLTEQTSALVDDAILALGLTGQESLLDIGCAAGLAGEHLSREARRYVGLDISSGAIARFRERCPRLELHVGSALALPFAAQEFDVSMLGSILLCLSPAEGLQALREARRVTRRRCFVSGTPRGVAPACQWPDNPTCHCSAHATWYEPEALMLMARGCGWPFATVRPISDKLPQARYMFDLLLEAKR